MAEKDLEGDAEKFFCKDCTVKQFAEKAKSVLGPIFKMDSMSTCRYPVPKSVEHYHAVIDTPMDLSTMQQKVSCVSLSPVSQQTSQ